MKRTYSVLIALSGILLIASCSGGGIEPSRTPSARDIIVVRPGTSTGMAGSPCLIYFYDDGSSSSNGPIVKYEWNFGGGWEDWTSTDGFAYHSYDAPDTYNAHLRVTDSTGRKAVGKVKVVVVQGYDSDIVRMYWGADESDEFRPGADGKSYRYHEWRWRCLAYDPEDSKYGENHVLAVSPGDPDFDMLVVYSEGSEKDFVVADLDGDGVGDDPSVKRTFVLPHVLEVSGSCLGRGKQDVYVWKITSFSKTYGKAHELKGHVTLIK
ncbi:MAG: hypothetical protein HRF49_09035 [bacterium]|jgi:hypothetical protein